MTRTLYTLLILCTCALSACATNKTDEKFAADDCKSINSLFRDQNLSVSAYDARVDTDYAAEKSKDKFTLPWETSNADKVSKERAAMRKAHNRKGCAE